MGENLESIGAPEPAGESPRFLNVLAQLLGSVEAVDENRLATTAFAAEGATAVRIRGRSAFAG